MKLIVHTFVSLDGVMQGPGGADEDRTGGFERGGWVVPHFDEAVGRVVDGWFTAADAIVLGRVTFDMMRSYWPQVTDPDDTVATALNRLPKYVVSNSLTEPDWGDTTVVSGDVVAEMERLKSQPGRELQVHGSWELVQTLRSHGLADAYRLLVFPVVVGSGKRLFPEGSDLTTFSVSDTDVTPSGVIAMTLRPAAGPGTGEFHVEDGREVADVHHSTH